MFIRIGVVVVAWLAILSGAAGALVGVFAAVVGVVLETQAPTGHFTAGGISGMALLMIGLVFMIIGIAQIIVGVGLWQMRGWAWTLSVVIQSLALLGALGGLFTGAFTVQSLITIAISGAILFYLLSPRVRKIFTRRAAQVA